MPTLNGKPQHPFYTNERVARVVAQRLVSEGRDVGAWRTPPTTSEEHATRVDVLTEKLKERVIKSKNEKELTRKKEVIE